MKKMFNDYKTIKKIKAFRKKTGRDEFFSKLKIDLGEYVKNNPITVINNKEERLNKQISLNIFNSFKLKTMPALIIALVAILSGGGATFASQGSIPGDVLYPVKTLTEEVRTIATVNPEAKAKLQIKFAKERIEEVKEVLQKEGADSKNLGQALKNLRKNLAKVNDVIAKEKTKGKDVSKLAKEINDDLNESGAELNDALTEAQDVIDGEVATIEEDLAEAEATGDTETADELSSDLEEALNDSEVIEEAATEADEAMEEEENKIEEEMEKKEAAEEAMNEAKEALDELLAEFADVDETTQAIIDEALGRYNSFMEKSQEALDNEHFVQARQHAVQAERSLKDVIREVKKQERKKNIEAKREEIKKRIETKREEAKGRSEGKNASTVISEDEDSEDGEDEEDEEDNEDGEDNEVED